MRGPYFGLIFIKCLWYFGVPFHVGRSRYFLKTASKNLHHYHLHRHKTGLLVVPTLRLKPVPPAMEVASLKQNLNESSNVKQMSVSTATLLGNQLLVVRLLFYCGSCGRLPVNGFTVVGYQLTGGFTVVGYQLTGGFTVVPVVGSQ